MTGPWATVAAVAVALVLIGCGSEGATGSDGAAGADGSDPDGPATPPVVAELCRAAAQPAEADERFAGVHGPLHELAVEVQQQDRPAAAALLEAKNAVEDSLAEREPAPDELAGHLERLVATVRDGLAALDRPAPPCGFDLSTR